MASELPKPSPGEVLRFLRTCPMLHGLADDELAPLAEALTLARYDDRTRLFVEAIPDADHPLRLIIHGHATWSSSRAAEHPGAWELGPGSLFGLGAVDDWARRSDIVSAWLRRGLPTISCRCKGPLWVLELAPERFAAVFEATPDRALLQRLLAMFPTIVHAPDIVAALRQTVDFGRASPQSLFRLLESAPMHDFGSTEDKLEDDAKDQLPSPDDELIPVPSPNQDQDQDEDELSASDIVAAKQETKRARCLYYVLSGELRVPVARQLLALRSGELDGPDLFAPMTKEETDADTQTTPWAASAERCLAVALSRDAVERMIQTTPGFARSLGPLERSKRGKA
ncbi:hypothetical protein G6O69_31695 [Pseudenhygromyxa sp. WMMC2535]|uniref:hypothetical protein n=1 Tax=Pseudenhygromyxa sp. WMMC2535 TaxID=2712867 RepID=UPI001552783D|nr:hypothetical protein [Pseudenhygromyxa sp. WMMC2535]NVB42430.1 hypothetical protein [Pseudenhygromyxa sp. WMMC2535]